MSHELVKRVKMCPCCRKFEAAPPKAKLQPLPCSGPGEILHVDFTSIEESVNLQEAPAIRNALVIQDHFSKYVVAYVVKDSDGCNRHPYPEAWLLRSVWGACLPHQ